MTAEDQRLLRTAAEIIEADDNQGELRGIVNRLRALADRKPPEGSIHVRAAVAVDGLGRWEIAGYHGWREGTTPELLTEARESPNRALHWVEADVPLPASKAIKAATAC